MNQPYLKYSTVLILPSISEACNHTSDAEKGKIEIRPAIPTISEATVESELIEKNIVCIQNLGDSIGDFLSRFGFSCHLKYCI